MKKKQGGYTAMELMIVLGGIATLVTVVGILYVAIHFIAKFW